MGIAIFRGIGATNQSPSIRHRILLKPKGPVLLKIRWQFQLATHHMDNEAMLLLDDLLRLPLLPSTTATAPAVRFLAAVASGDSFP